MAIEYVGGKVVAFPGKASGYDTVSLTGLAGGLASAPAQGDLIVVAYSRNVSFTSFDVDTAGYTALAAVSQGDAYASILYAGYKFAGSTPDTAVGVAASGNTSRPNAAVVSVWRGVDPSSPLDVATTTAQSNNSSVPNPPSITPVTSGVVVISVGATSCDPALVYGAFTSSDLSDFISDVATETSADIIIGTGYLAWTSGAANPAAFGTDGTDETSAWTAISIALRPAVVTLSTLSASLDDIALSALSDTAIAGSFSADVDALLLSGTSQMTLSGVLVGLTRTVTNYLDWTPDLSNWLEINCTVSTSEGIEYLFDADGVLATDRATRVLGTQAPAGGAYSYAVEFKQGTSTKTRFDCYEAGMGATYVFYQDIVWSGAVPVLDAAFQVSNAALTELDDGWWLLTLDCSTAALPIHRTDIQIDRTVGGGTISVRYPRLNLGHGTYDFVPTAGAPVTADVVAALLDNVLLAAFGKLPGGSLALTLDDVVLDAAATLVVAGQVDAVLDGIALSAAGSLTLTGAAVVAIAEVTLGAAGTVPGGGSFSLALDDTGLDAFGGNFIAAITPASRRLTITASRAAQRRLTVPASRAAQRRLNIGD